MRAVVTGGAGFIGHHIVRALLQRGDEVAVIDDLSTGFAWRLDEVRPDIEFVEGSILDAAALDRVMVGAEVVFHQAAIPSVARSVLDPRASNIANVDGTIEVMLAAMRHGIRRVLYAGSSSVYGVPKELPCHETMRAAPMSPYGAGKLAAEHYVHTLGALHGVETAVLRYFNVFGPGQDPTSEYSAVIPRFVTSTLERRRPTINGNGEVSRDFTYVDNVVSGNLLGASPTSPTGITCNVACGERYDLIELLETIGDAAGGRVEPIFGPPRPGDIVHSQADISLARSALGYKPIVPFREGIARTVAWYREHRGDPALASGGSTSPRA
jgi:UDP-N-acetylglucosamine/UDP-N-acetyl-alpha-D-glucosaminouronate 4-epimerase